MEITVIGSTGSIGTQTLEIARAHESMRTKHNINVTALTAGTNVKLLAEQAREFRVKLAAIADESLFCDLKIALADTDIKVAAGAAAISEAAAKKADRVVNAAVGIAGLLPTEAAIKAGNDVALANKETLVAGGEYIMKLARGNGVRVNGEFVHEKSVQSSGDSARENRVRILPVDSEHSAIFQCLQTVSGYKTDYSADINKIILTCSGGAFFDRDDLSGITPADIFNPNWDMGKKVTLDSATLANKGLEFIEAVRLFGVAPSQIEVVIHRESILHSAVEFADGAVIAELGTPDMRLPIQYALFYPERKPSPAKRLSLSDIGKLTFAKPDYETFTALSGFIKALEKGGGYTAIANAVNETAGALFLAGKIPFTRIGELIHEAVETLPPMSVNNIGEIMNANAAGVEFVQARCK